jgi:predicted RNA-binding protein YlxR (DUF448 family)
VTALSPKRTCMGCGTKGCKGRLLRFTISEEGILLLDLLQRRRGRGGYLCPKRECFRLALKKRRLTHGLRRNVVVDLEPWIQGVEHDLLGLIHGRVEKVTHLRRLGVHDIAGLCVTIEHDEVALAIVPSTPAVVENYGEIAACRMREKAEVVVAPPEVTEGEIIVMMRKPAGMKRLYQAIEQYTALRSGGESE